MSRRISEVLLLRGEDFSVGWTRPRAGPRVVPRLARESVEGLEDLAKLGLNGPFFLKT